METALTVGRVEIQSRVTVREDRALLRAAAALAAVIQADAQVTAEAAALVVAVTQHAPTQLECTLPERSCRWW
ncbi:MAG: hypothetical protein B7Y80_15585 [Hyphomicrobium sp. 32-62-53]|nr:MAG: hypothetical protein B7Y80_15585 [Hyphomicrobium sp. 32-62-53]